MREILSVGQPCILCEGTLEVWTIERDDETGLEDIRREPVPHDCLPMQALIKERAATPAQRAGLSWGRGQRD